MSGLAGIYGDDGVAIDKDNAAKGDFELIPVGWYPATVDKAEVRDTKKKNGKVLWLQFTILDSPAGFANRKLFTTINLVNPNEEAVKIGRRELDGLASACGITRLRKEEELIGKTVDARVTVKKGNEGYEDDNKISAYEPIGTKSGKAPAAKKLAPAAKTAEKPKAWDQPPAAPAPAQQQAPPPAAAPTRGKLPWEK